MKSKSFQHLIKIRLKNEPLHVVRGPIFSATDDILTVTASKINAKSMFEKGMQKLMNMILKRDENRGPNPMNIRLKIEVDKMTIQNQYISRPGATSG